MVFEKLLQDTQDPPGLPPPPQICIPQHMSMHMKNTKQSCCRIRTTLIRLSRGDGDGGDGDGGGGEGSGGPEATAFRDASCGSPLRRSSAIRLRAQEWEAGGARTREARAMKARAMEETAMEATAMEAAAMEAVSCILAAWPASEPVAS